MQFFIRTPICTKFYSCKKWVLHSPAQDTLVGQSFEDHLTVKRDGDERRRISLAHRGVPASDVGAVVFGPPGEVLHYKGCIKVAPQHPKEEEGCWHGSSPKRGHDGGATPMSGGSGNGDGGPVVPRSTLWYGGAPCPAQGGWEAVR
jgi:hypothetical protein